GGGISPRLRLGSPSMGLALAELEAGARATLTVLLALDDARVTRDVAGLLEGRAERGVDLDEGASDAEADGLGLAREAAARHVDVDVVTAERLGELERLAQHHLRRGATEVIVDLALVDGDPARAGHHPHARHRLLAAARRVEGVLFDLNRGGLSHFLVLLSGPAGA